MCYVMEKHFNNWLTQIKKGYLDLCILMLIEANQKAYGFQIIALLEDLNLSIKEGTLYPLLNRMTADELLTAKWETENIQGNPRKFYSVTPQGLKTLEQMTLEFQSMNKIFTKIKKIGG